jgi:hypothetical protein
MTNAPNRLRTIKASLAFGLLLFVLLPSPDGWPGHQDVNAYFSAVQDKERTAPPVKPEDEAAILEFEKQLKAYVAMHKTLESKLTPLGDEATPQEIDKNQRALGALIENARRTTKAGDLLTPAIQVIVRRELGRIFSGPEGKQLKASIMDENPIAPKLRVNMRYPDTVPMSTMPPEVLAVLPPLPEELNYRFIGNSLLLLDTQAHIIVDFIDNALPRG